ncbi:hypothetical protein D3C77_615510 [compost metagenome]
MEGLTKLLGITTDELKEALKDRTSLADLAVKQGVDVDTVINLLVNVETEKLKEQLEAGKIPQDKYDARIADLLDTVTKQVNREFSAKQENETQN